MKQSTQNLIYLFLMFLGLIISQSAMALEYGKTITITTQDEISYEDLISNASTVSPSKRVATRILVKNGKNFSIKLPNGSSTTCSGVGTITNNGESILFTEAGDLLFSYSLNGTNYHVLGHINYYGILQCDGNDAPKKIGVVKNDDSRIGLELNGISYISETEELNVPEGKFGAIWWSGNIIGNSPTIDLIEGQTCMRTTLATILSNAKKIIPNYTGEIVLDTEFDDGTPNVLSDGNYGGVSHDQVEIYDCRTTSYTISLTASPAESGTVQGAGSYEENKSVTVTATPNEGYQFVKWTENGTQVSTQASYSFTATKDRTLVANFKKKSYTITADKSPTTGGSTTGSGTYEHGSTVTLTATANTEYSFVNWTENSVVVSTNSTYSFTATKNRNLVANFTKNTYSVDNYILNPSFESGTDGWTVKDLQQQSNSYFNKKNGNIYMEKWTGIGGAVGSASATQTLTALPAGKYRLTVAAHNIVQREKVEHDGIGNGVDQTGASIYAGATTNATTVTKPADYSVEFSTPGTNVTIGFLAVNASGNWICVDNFRLTYVAPDFELLQTAITNAKAAITAAEKSNMAGIQPTLKANLEAAISTAEALTAEDSEEMLKTSSFEIAENQVIVEHNAAQLKDLKTTANKAKAMLSRDMAEKYKVELQALYDEALLLLAFEKEGSPLEMNTRLTAAFDAANESYNAKRNLKTKISQAKNLQDDEKLGNEAFLAAIAAAEAVRDREDATPEEMAEATAAMETATLQYRIDNGTGDTPNATTITSFYIPAAHGALIRATLPTGNNIKEAGICWSTDREPKVTDHRCTDYYTLNGNLYHIKDMEPSSVYYVRAYAMTTKYRVGYGEVMKIVTLPVGTCWGTWDGGAPDAAANERCRNAIQETMDYLNEWTAIKGFHLDGHYGSGTPTADCSYGGYMRIGPNASNQAIGTVIHETGHGVGVGQHWRWYSCDDTRESQGKYGKWLGKWANKTLQFLEKNYGEGCFFTGDAVHGWGNNASYDWFVNGSNKDTHEPFQYIGGCALLYALYIDGLPPTSSYPNGVPGYTFNFDDTKKYYIKCEDANRGLYDGFLYQRTSTAAAWKVAYRNDLDDDAAWYIEFDAKTGFYRFKNVGSGKYLSHPSAISMVSTSSPSSNQNFQLMPGRKDLVINEGSASYTVPSFWFTWDNSGNKSMTMGALSKATGYGTVSVADFNYSDAGGTMQRYVILAEDELEAYETAALPTGIRSVAVEDCADDAASTAVYSLDGRLMQTLPAGEHSLSNSRLPRGIYMVRGKKVVVR